MFSTFDDPLVKVTPWHTLSKEMRTLLGGEYNWASWMSHPLSGYSLHFFLKAFELGKLQLFGGTEPQAEGVHRRIQVTL